MEHFEHDYFLGLRNFGGILFFEYILVDLNLLNSFTAAKNPKEAYELLVNTVKDNKKVLLSEVPDMLKDDRVQENGIDLIISRIEIEKNIPTQLMKEFSLQKQ